MVTTKDSGNVCKILLDLGQTYFSSISYTIHAPEPTWPGCAPCLRAQVLPEGTVPILDLALETDVSGGADCCEHWQRQLSGHS